MKTIVRFILALLLIDGFAWGATIPLSGTIFLPDGTRFNGTVRMTLNYPARDTVDNVDVVPMPITFRVNNGVIQASAAIRPNDILQPANTIYVTEYFSPTGAKVMQKNFYVSGSQFNLGTAVPTTITSSNISFTQLIGGSGTTNRVPVWTGAATLGAGSIADVGSVVSLTGAETQSHNGVVYLNSSKNIKTDQSNLFYDDTNKRLYIGFGPLAGVTGNGQVLAPGSGGFLVATANADASTLAMNVVSGLYTALNSGFVGGGTALPFALFTGQHLALRVTTDPFLQLEQSFTAANPKCALGTVGLRNNAGTLEKCENAGSWTAIGGAGGGGGWTDDGTIVRLTTGSDRVMLGDVTSDVSGGNLIAMGTNAALVAATSSLNASTLSLSASTICGCTALTSGRTGIGTFYPINFYTNSNLRFTISTAGAMQWQAYGAGTLTTDASGNITATSDERLKEDIRAYPIGLEAIRKVSPIMYRWNGVSGMDMDHDYLGFSAQNIQSAIPLGVGVNENGMLTLQDRALLATVVNAVKQLDQRLSQVESK